MRDKTLAWKKKVDPAFDTFLRTFNEALLSMVEPSEEDIEVQLKKMEGGDVRSFRQFYEKEEGLESLLEVASLLDTEGSANSSQMMAESSGAIPEDVMYSLFMGVVSQLDNKESTEYYTRVFEPLSSKDKRNYFLNKSDDEKKKLVKAWGADFTALLFHLFVNDVNNLDLEKDKARIIGLLDGENILHFSFMLLDKASLIVNKKSMRVLYREAKEGNVDSLIKLLKIDKTLFDHEWVRDLMLRAMITDDTAFLKKIGHAIMTEPPLGKSMSSF